MKRIPVSEELRDKILLKLGTKDIVPGMHSMKKGLKKSEIIFLTSDGEILCQVSTSKSFICFKLPSGRTLGVPKDQLA